jgi:hypothetical protein
LHQCNYQKVEVEEVFELVVEDHRYEGDEIVARIVYAVRDEVLREDLAVALNRPRLGLNGLE